MVFIIPLMRGEVRKALVEERSLVFSRSGQELSRVILSIRVIIASRVKMESSVTSKPIAHTVLRGKTRINANGRIVIPAPIREKMGLSADDTLLMEVVDGVLHVESYSTRIRRVQESLRQYIQPGRLLSDELIADRREEARREEEEMARDRAAHGTYFERAG
jgi:AbrB family looped-hinge helix DNA binding protein